MTSKLIVVGQENTVTERKVERSVQGETIAFSKVLREEQSNSGGVEDGPVFLEKMNNSQGRG